MVVTHNNVKVSVIVPAYNEAPTITACIESLLFQDYRDDYEIIVVNDGSIDDTGNIVRSLATEHSRITLISKENGGKGSAQNAGLQYARGALVLVTDADAILPSDWISLMKKELDNADIIVGACYISISASSSIIERAQNAQYLIQFKYGRLKGIPSVGINLGFKKVIVDSLGGFNESIKSTTAEFVKRSIKNGYTIRFNPDIVVKTRTASNFIGFIKQKLRWREYPLDILKKNLRPSGSDILSIGYTHGLSFLLFVLTLIAIITLDYRYLLAPLVLIFLADIVIYSRPLYRMWRARTDRDYSPFVLLYLLLILPVRFILVPYLAYCLFTGTKPSFEPKRS